MHSACIQTLPPQRDILVPCTSPLPNPHRVKGCDLGVGGCAEVSACMQAHGQDRTFMSRALTQQAWGKQCRLGEEHCCEMQFCNSFSILTRRCICRDATCMHRAELEHSMHSVTAACSGHHLLQQHRTVMRPSWQRTVNNFEATSSLISVPGLPCHVTSQPHCPSAMHHASPACDGPMQRHGKRT